MQIFSPSHFSDYNRNLRRVMWAELIDRQMMLKRRQNFRATIVGDPFAPRPVLSDVLAEPQFGAIVKTAIEPN